MKTIKLSLTTVLVLIALTSLVVAAVMFTREIANTMYLRADYTLAIYETGTTTPCTSIDWNGFNEGESKQYVVDMINVGNSRAYVDWISAIPSGWSITLEQKNRDATSYTPWSLGEKFMLDPLIDPKNIRITLIETTATVGISYSFTLTFRAHDS